jgi:hypothetical protein
LRDIFNLEIPQWRPTPEAVKTSRIGTSGKKAVLRNNGQQESQIHPKGF